MRYKLGDYEGVIADYKELVRVQPGYAYQIGKEHVAESYAKRGIQREKLGDERSALESFDEAVKLDPAKSRILSLSGNSKETPGRHCWRKNLKHENTVNSKTR